ncbi:histidine kinase [Halococcus sp. AFM35]|uniref:histidine kinase n=1 Tax=Halococcus sp. AFM35 TaxID=3421653 RepID=UPI003EBA9DFA
MSQETRTETTATTGTGIADWQAGVVGGLVGGAAMGAMITMTMPSVIEMAIPALYGLQGGLAGWVVHMAHSAVLGVVFVAIAANTGLGRGIGRSAVAGLVYGVVLWAVLAALVMPIWLQTLGFPGAPPFPNFALPGSLPAHAVYGVLLGALVPFLGN